MLMEQRSTIRRRGRPGRVCALVCRVFILALVATACGGASPLADDVRPDAVASVRFVAASTGIELSDLDAACAADSLGDESARTLVDAGDEPSQAHVALVLDEVIDCVGARQIAISAITPQVPTASEESIACAANEFDHDLLVSLLTGGDQGDPTLGPRLELELAGALATCLSPEELLDLGE